MNYVPERLLIALTQRRRALKRAEEIDPGVRLALQIVERERMEDEDAARANAPV